MLDMEKRHGTVRPNMKDDEATRGGVRLPVETQGVNPLRNQRYFEHRGGGAGRDRWVLPLKCGVRTCGAIHGGCMLDCSLARIFEPDRSAFFCSNLLFHFALYRHPRASIPSFHVLTCHS